ncbi:MAG: hypothetical protein CV088_08340 [Nitrospira sp. LK70]|nr:hypothetical protein [Nitrospira sp. LK70]
MKRDQELRRLRRLQSEIDSIRRLLGISSPGTVVYSSPLRSLEDEVVVVEADGMGGATTSVIGGNYPIDFTTKYEERFASEEMAIRKAENLVGQVDLL